MSVERRPAAQHERFERLCAEVEDYDALPTVAPTPPERGPQHDEDGRSVRLDDHILALLVSPY